jgi:anti-sigma factor RsiW
MDGELDLVRALDFEAHLHDCRGCSRLCDDHRALRSALQEGGLRFAAPPKLERRIVSQLRRANSSGPQRWFRRLALAATVLLAIGAGALIAWCWRPRAVPGTVDEVVGVHVRSLMLENHLLDYPSDNQHKIKPFFRAKIDYAPWVKNLEPEGFPLLGARLDYLERRKVAVLVFKRREHIINLFSRPTTEPDEALQPFQSQGYHLFHWTGNGMCWWVVSDLNPDELREFAAAVREAADR